MRRPHRRLPEDSVQVASSLDEILSGIDRAVR
jgi:hypothetical protein